MLLGWSISLSYAFLIQGFNFPSVVTPSKSLQSSPLKDEPFVGLNQEDGMSSAMTKSIDELKTKLIKTILSMSQTNPTQFKVTVETCINTLEQKYIPPLTLDFFNMIMSGEWLFLLSTHDSQIRMNRRIRIMDLSQTMETHQLKGQVNHRASWNFLDDEEDEGSYTYGVFTSNTPYNIGQGSRISFGSQCDLSLSISKGSKSPKDPQMLVAWIRKVLPTEMFDPSNLALDTTFLDPDLRIIRFAGSTQYEGLRHVYIRRETLSKFQL